MTQVQFDYGERYRLIAEGHATGSVEVCAAVSTITQSLYGYVYNLQRTGDAEIVEKSIASGKFSLCAKGDDRLRGAFELAKQGLLQLANSFPEYVAIKK